MSPPSIWNLVALNPFPDVQCWIQIVCRFLNKKGTFISLHHLHSSWSLNFVCGGRGGNVSVAGLCKRDIYFAPTGLSIRPETVASLSVASDLCVLSQNNLTSGVSKVYCFLCVETISVRFEFLCRESTRSSDQRPEYHIGKTFPCMRVWIWGFVPTLQLKLSYTHAYFFHKLYHHNYTNIHDHILFWFYVIIYLLYVVANVGCVSLMQTDCCSLS